MTFILGHLPENVDEENIKELFCQFANVITDVIFLENSIACRHSEYECMVKLSISSSIVGFCIQNRMNNYCWKGQRIHSHMLVF